MGDHMAYSKLTYADGGTGDTGMSVEGVVVPGGTTIAGGKSTSGWKERYRLQGQIRGGGYQGY